MTHEAAIETWAYLTLVLFASYPIVKLLEVVFAPS